MNGIYELYGAKFLKHERANCEDIVNRIIELSNITRQQGILVLEEAVKREESFILRTGIRLIVDGTDPTLVKHILHNFIISNHYKGHELLVAIIAAEGILEMQKGVNPAILAAYLVSMIGEEYTYLCGGKDHPGYFTSEEDNSRIYHELLKRFKSKVAASHSAEFDSKLVSMHVGFVKGLLLSIDDSMVWTMALKGCGFEAIKKCTNNLSIRNAISTLEMLEFINPDEKHITEAQKKMLDILDKLLHPQFMGNVIDVFTYKIEDDNAN